MRRSKKPSPIVVRSAASIGKYVATWRRVSRITSEELAARAGVSRDTISRLEHGDPSVGLDKVLAVARVLGILDRVEAAFDPSTTEVGRMRMTEALPQRVRK